MDPQGLAELVAYEGAAIWLFRRLRAAGALDALPADQAERLRAQAFEAAALRMRVEEEAASVLGLFGSEGVPVILIKGVARCALAQQFPHLDARTMRDVDLLLPHGTIRAAHDLLKARGYVPTRVRSDSEPWHHHHLPALMNERQVAVELHESTSSRVPAELAWERASARSEEVDWAGLMVRVPCPTELAWSAIAHGLTDGARGFRLERFLEVAALVGDGAPVDWEVIRDRSRGPEAGDEAAPPGEAAVLVRRWLDAALAFVPPSRRPPEFAGAESDLREMLQWRLIALGAARRLGRGFAGRLLEEGPRALLGLPIRPSPPETRWPARFRRQTAARAGRVLFRTWHAYYLRVANTFSISHQPAP